MKWGVAIVQWRDEYQDTLALDEGFEVKLVMTQGQQALYQWSAHGSVVYHDTHGEGAGLDISDEKGHGVPQTTAHSLLHLMVNMAGGGGIPLKRW